MENKYSKIPNNYTYGNYINYNSQSDYVYNHKNIENLLKLNKGKKVSIYQSFYDSSEYRDKVFTGIIEESGDDYIVLSDPNTGDEYLLKLKHINFIKFDERINTNDQFYTSNF